MNEDKSARYHRLKRWASVLSLVLTAGLLGVLLVGGASALMRDVAVHVGGASPPAVVAIYVLIIGFLQEAVTFPVSFYRSLTLERQYGLSCEPFWRWMRDHVKGLLVA